MIIRALTDPQVDMFRNALLRLRETPSTALGFDALEMIGSAQEVPGAGAVEQIQFRSKLDLAKHLSSALEGVDRTVVDLNVGMWTWLALYYFDQLVRRDDSESIQLRDLALYVPALHSWREYRHLVRGPYKVFQTHGEAARLLLLKPVNVWSDLEEQLVGVQELLRMPAAMRAADILYFDGRKQAAKRGVTNRNRQGNIRRFGAVLQQFDLTYDLYDMTSEQLVEMLPREFDSWRR